MSKLQSSFFRVVSNYQNVPLLLTNNKVIEPIFTIKHGDISIFNFESILQYLYDIFNEDVNDEDEYNIYTKEQILRSREIIHLEEYGRIYFNDVTLEIVPNEILTYCARDIAKSNKDISFNAWLLFFHSEQSNLLSPYYKKDIAFIIEKMKLSQYMTYETKDNLINDYSKFLFKEKEISDNTFENLYGKSFSVNIDGKIYETYVSISEGEICLHNKAGDFFNYDRIQQLFILYID